MAVFATQLGHRGDTAKLDARGWYPDILTLMMKRDGVVISLIELMVFPAFQRDGSHSHIATFVPS